MNRAGPGRSRLQRLWRLPRIRIQLLRETGWALACASWRVRRWPFARLAATLGTPTVAVMPADASSDDPGTPPGPGALVAAGDVRWAIAAWARRLRPAPTCLVQAAAAQRVLARHGLCSTLYFGVQSTAATAASASTKNALGAHAWLRCAGLVVTGEREAAAFRPIAAYRLAPGPGPR